jgi:hypothetical protein
MGKQMNKWHIALAIHHCDSLVMVGNINNRFMLIASSKKQIANSS